VGTAASARRGQGLGPRLGSPGARRAAGKGTVPLQPPAQPARAGPGRIPAPRGLLRAAHTQHGAGGGFTDMRPHGHVVQSWDLARLRSLAGAAASPWLRDAGPPLR